MNAEFFALAFTAALNPKLLGIDLLLIENRRSRAMFLCLLLGGLTVALTIGLLDVLVLHADAINSQKTVSAGIDLALGLLLLAIGGLVATGLWVPKTCVTWADAQGMPSAQRSVPGGRRAVCAWAGVR